MRSRRNRYRARVRIKKTAKGKRTPGPGPARGPHASFPFKAFSLGLVMMVSVCAIAWGVLQILTVSSVFAVTQVTVAGASTLTSDEVRALAAVERGANLFSIHLGQIRAQIEEEPSIRRATVRRILPGTVSILIDQRRPIAQVKAGRYYLVDAEGVVVPPILKFADPTLPVITNSSFNRRRAKVGEPYTSDKMDASLALLRALGKVSLPFKGRVRSIDARILKELSFEVEPGIEIHIGRSGFSKKLALLDEIYDGIQDEINDVKYIDLRFDDVVIGHR